MGHRVGSCGSGREVRQSAFNPTQRGALPRNRIFREGKMGRKRDRAIFALDGDDSNLAVKHGNVTPDEQGRKPFFFIKGEHKNEVLWIEPQRMKYLYRSVVEGGEIPVDWKSPNLVPFTPFPNQSFSSPLG